ncbi:hypothetical protein HPB49_018824 [Dermacentor silvarum]|uniref:Uncharacterized protein n=1 Tax=Dermacentor silvarum TaxID=543639 RepID=A0ACB8CMD6_DERSI|nr:hypothetical protein HPB49_018824 [Dermacentor silvarum]
MGDSPELVPKPFRGLLLSERYPFEHPSVYAPEEARFLCPLCHVSESSRRAHHAGSLHRVQLALQSWPSAAGSRHRGGRYCFTPVPAPPPSPRRGIRCAPGATDGCRGTGSTGATSALGGPHLPRHGTLIRRGGGSMETPAAWQHPCATISIIGTGLMRLGHAKSAWAVIRKLGLG